MRVASLPEPCFGGHSMEMAEALVQGHQHHLLPSYKHKAYFLDDKYWFQCGSGYESGSSLLSQCGSRSGSMKVNQCGSMRIKIPVQILVRL
jgi:hypothetical protein